MYRKLDVLRSRVALSAPIYTRLLNSCFELSEETFVRCFQTFEANVTLKQMKLKKARSYLDLAEEEALITIWSWNSSVWSSRRMEPFF